MEYREITKTRFAELLDQEFARPLTLQSTRKVSSFDPIRHIARASGHPVFEYTPDVHVTLKRGQSGYVLSIT
jgi:hypothetical protein